MAMFGSICELNLEQMARLGTRSGYLMHKLSFIYPLFFISEIFVGYPDLVKVFWCGGISAEIYR